MLSEGFDVTIFSIIPKLVNNIVRVCSSGHWAMWTIQTLHTLHNFSTNSNGQQQRIGLTTEKRTWKKNTTHSIWEPQLLCQCVIVKMAVSKMRLNTVDGITTEANVDGVERSCVEYSINAHDGAVIIHVGSRRQLGRNYKRTLTIAVKTHTHQQFA